MCGKVIVCVCVCVWCKALHCAQSGAPILSQWARAKALNDPDLTRPLPLPQCVCVCVCVYACMCMRLAIIRSFVSAHHVYLCVCVCVCVNNTQQWKHTAIFMTVRQIQAPSQS